LKIKAIMGVAAVIAVTLTGCAPANAVTPAASYRTTVTETGVVLDAHRTGGLDLRENSIASAKALLGKVNVIDVDTQHLADGTPVLMHDMTVDRTTNGTGTVSKHSLTWWKTLTLNTGVGPKGERPPTLAQFLDALGGKVVLTVEAKSASSVPVIEKLIRARGLKDSVLINTNDPAVAKRIKLDGYKSHLWRSAAQMRTDNPASFLFADVVDIDYKATDADILRFTKTIAPRQVWGHTVNTQADVRRMIDLGCNGVITDKPLTVGRG